jgi:1,2-dihydroxy-3-keto-5-methylthiopentene dioxygenase
MATVKIPSERRTLTDQAEVTRYLAGLGIDYERWGGPADQRVPSDASPDAVLAAYAPEIDQLKKRGGYVTADVIDVTPATPGLDAMLAKFNTEHWHDEDEVRFIVRGRGLFHIHPRDGNPVIAIEVEAGDLIRVPRGTWHWFDLCADRDIRAIRLFQDKAGWTPHYTQSGVDKGYQPLCLGPTYIPLGAGTASR